MSYERESRRRPRWRIDRVRWGLTDMRMTALWAVATVLLTVPGAALAQDASPDEFDDWVTAYYCVEVVAAPDADAEAEILQGNFEIVDGAICSSTPGSSLDPFEPLILTGRGDTKTKPFTLPDGDYEFVVKVKGRDCDIAEIGLNSIEDGYEIEDFEGNDYAYGIEAGRYFLEGNYMDKKCVWTVRIQEFDE